MKHHLYQTMNFLFCFLFVYAMASRMNGAVLGVGNGYLRLFADMVMSGVIALQLCMLVLWKKESQKKSIVPYLIFAGCSFFISIPYGIFVTVLAVVDGMTEKYQIGFEKTLIVVLIHVVTIWMYMKLKINLVMTITWLFTALVLWRDEMKPGICMFVRKSLFFCEWVLFVPVVLHVLHEPQYLLHVRQWNWILVVLAGILLVSIVAEKRDFLFDEKIAKGLPCIGISCLLMKVSPVVFFLNLAGMLSSYAVDVLYHMIKQEEISSRMMTWIRFIMTFLVMSSFFLLYGNRMIDLSGLLVVGCINLYQLVEG